MKLYYFCDHKRGDQYKIECDDLKDALKQVFAYLIEDKTIHDELISFIQEVADCTFVDVNDCDKL